ncbi:uncharacterized protein [Narcine bancroftii]|uniref:uncharacterized protein n=1 Tax=Narcine bancroftii TaxID=1343680 RepID=UPI0038313FC6
MAEPMKGRVCPGPQRGPAAGNSSWCSNPAHPLSCKDKEQCNSRLAVDEGLDGAGLSQEELPQVWTSQSTSGPSLREGIRREGVETGVARIQPCGTTSLVTDCTLSKSILGPEKHRDPISGTLQDQCLSRGPGRVGCGGEFLDTDPSPRRKRKILRSSFTILERSEAEARGLPVIGWDEGSTLNGPRDQGSVHYPMRQGAQGDPTRGAELGGEEYEVLNEVVQEEQEDPTEVVQEGLEDAIEVNNEEWEDPTEVVQKELEDFTELVQEGWVVQEDREDPTVVVQEDREDPTEVVQGGREDPTEVVQGGREDPTEVVQGGREDPTEVVQGGREDPTEVVQGGREDPTEVVQGGREDPTEVVQGGREDPTEVVQGGREDPTEVVQGGREDPTEVVQGGREDPTEVVQGGREDPTEVVQGGREDPTEVVQGGREDPTEVVQGGREDPTEVVQGGREDPTEVVQGGREDPTEVVQGGREDPTEVVREDPTEVVREDPTEVVREDPTEVVREDPTEVVREDPTEVVREDPTEVVREDPTEVVREDPTEVVREDPTEVVREDPTEVVREDPTEVVREDPTEVVREDPTEVVREDPTEVVREDPTEVVREDPTEERQEDSTEAVQGRLSSRRLTYVIKSRGASEQEREAGLQAGESQEDARPLPGGGRLTSFAEQKQLKEKRPRRSLQAGLRRSPGSPGTRLGPEWIQVRQRLEVKQEEIRARLQAREAWLGRRWQSLGRRAYSRLLKLAGREGESCRDQTQEGLALGLEEGSVAGIQVQLRTLSLDQAPGPPEMQTLSLAPNAEPVQGSKGGKGVDLGSGVEGEMARPCQMTAQDDPSSSEWKLPEIGGQEPKESEVSSPEWLGLRLLNLSSGDFSLPTSQQVAAPRRRRRDARREQPEAVTRWRARSRPLPDRDGERIGNSAPAAEPTAGLKLFKEPITKSNRLILYNALTYCCLAGKVNEAQRGQVIQELVRCDQVQCLILFRDHHCQFRALYSFCTDTSGIQRLWGTGPKLIHMEMVEGLYKYNSDRKQFHLIPSKIMSPNVDGLTIHGHLWSARKRSALGGERK